MFRRKRFGEYETEEEAAKAYDAAARAAKGRLDFSKLNRSPILLMRFNSNGMLKDCSYIYDYGYHPM